jgi:cysteinyl-tRNA synthetase
LRVSVGVGDCCAIDEGLDQQNSSKKVANSRQVAGKLARFPDAILGKRVVDPASGAVLKALFRAGPTPLFSEFIPTIRNHRLILSTPRMLRIFNTLSRSKETFVPIEPGKIRMYVCGMTVYDYCHVGHARVLVVFDAVQRWLRASGYQLTYVRNITDIDDRIIKRAVENGETIGQLTQRFIDAMHADERALGVQPPDHEPRATGYVPQMVSLIESLQQKGLAYAAPEGDMNYSVRKFPGYGKLSGKSLDELRAGERVAVSEGKHDPLDFVLWKSAKVEEPEEVKWRSPFGVGRPGWHIECSAMSATLLGQTIDIHGGGADLQFPHHENEIAQSEGAYGHDGEHQKFVRYWMHNGFVRIDDVKMSKSLGNFFTIREVLAKYDPEVIRLFILRAHYRSPITYSDVHLDDARASLLRFYTALANASVAANASNASSVTTAAVTSTSTPTAQSAESASPEVAAGLAQFRERFAEAMNDDFNTPIAVAVLFEIAAELNRSPSAALASLLRELGGVLGLLQRDAAEVKQRGLVGLEVAASTADDDAQIEQMVQERVAAKKIRNYVLADKIRAELTARGIAVEDSAGASVWRRS